MAKVAAQWVPPARITHPYPQQRFIVKHPRWEPSALAAHARICPGGAGNGRPYRDGDELSLRGGSNFRDRWSGEELRCKRIDSAAKAVAGVQAGGVDIAALIVSTADVEPAVPSS